MRLSSGVRCDMSGRSAITVSSAGSGSWPPRRFFRGSTLGPGSSTARRRIYQDARARKKSRKARRRRGGLGVPVCRHDAIGTAKRNLSVNFCSSGGPLTMIITIVGRIRVRWGDEGGTVTRAQERLLERLRLRDVLVLCESSATE